MCKVVYVKSLEFGDIEDCYAKINIELREREWGIELAITGKCFAEDIKSSGQCIDTIAEKFPDNKKINRIKEIWEKYHLNGYHAGCEHQREFEKEPYDNHRGAYCAICDYVYGTAWKYEIIPDEIIEEIKSW
jgi:hypothetical protein